VRFDLTTLLYGNVLYILVMILPFDYRFSRVFQQIAKYFFFVVNGAALGANVSDFIYFRFTGRRTTADVFQQFANETNMGSLWLRFLVDYWYALVFWAALMVLLVWGYNRVTIQGRQLRNAAVYYISGVLIIPIIAYFIVGGIRGGFAHSTRPITLSNAGEYVKDPSEISIVLNTPFALIRTIGKTQVQKTDYFTPQELEAIYSPVHAGDTTGQFRKDNVVVIILESFSKEFIGALNRHREHGHYKGYTPFLDSLIQYSHTFEYSFANGRKSIDGLPSVISSIPSLGVPYFLSPYSGNNINSLASLLGDEGYHTSFFHGAPNGSMGFQAFMNLAGVDHYYGKTEYNNDDDYDGIWGIWDDKFLGFYADKLSEFPQPFMSSLFSVSSHHPFEIPERYKSRFKGGPMVIHRCIQYTDYSLKLFFEKASKQPWFRNTLFVITADHTSSEIEFKDSRTAWGYYAVPIIFYKPDNSLAAHEHTIAQQIDIMPTVLSYLHLDKPYVAFGRDAFSNSEEPFAFNYKDNVYQLIEGDYLLQFDGQKSVALYDFKHDTLQVNNLVREKPEAVGKMERKIKAVIQQYNTRLIENRMNMINGLRDKQDE
jgi:phosphoglycerol transferase MdoB-like AlkP superfamily enzyme